jgi:hypothetical protein
MGLSANRRSVAAKDMRLLVGNTIAGAAKILNMIYPNASDHAAVAIKDIHRI